MLEGETLIGVLASRCESPGVEDPLVATHRVFKATSETPRVLMAQGCVLDPIMTSNHDDSSMPAKPNRQQRQMTLWESDDPIVPMTPGNAGRVGRFASRDSQRWGEGSPGTFVFLGFMHYRGQSHAGKFKLKRRTAAKKFRSKVADLKAWFRSKLTTSIAEVWASLSRRRSAELGILPVVPRSSSASVAGPFEGLDRDGEDAVMPGEKCRLGAGCVNGASPVLRGIDLQLDGSSRNLVAVSPGPRFLGIAAMSESLAKRGYRQAENPLPRRTRQGA